MTPILPLTEEREPLLDGTHQAIWGACPHCGSASTPVLATALTEYADLDCEDAAYAARDGSVELCVADEIAIGLHLCRDCGRVLEYWIESGPDAPFRSDWGASRPAGDPV